MDQRAAPGIIRDSIVSYLTAAENASIAEIREAIASQLGDAVPASSVRSYLNLNTPDMFERTSRGHYRLRATSSRPPDARPEARYVIGRATLIETNCFDWLRAREARSIHAVVTDPPYGLLEYSHVEQAKLRNRRGGVWRIPPSFDGHLRAPVPRFTVLDEGDRQVLHDFFFEVSVLHFELRFEMLNFLKRAGVGDGRAKVVGKNPLPDVPVICRLDAGKNGEHAKDFASKRDRRADASANFFRA